MEQRWLALVILGVVLVFSSVQGDDTESKGKGGETEEKRYEVAAFEWSDVQVPYTIALWILLASVAKIGFHVSKRFADIFPDSSLLIMVGLIVGIILSLANVDQSTFSLDSQIFFLYLLPPIVFDAGYFMPNRAFFDNLGTILVFAVLGTVWNMATIGLSLWAIGLTGVFSVETPLLHVLLFTSLISAVDPVAVIVVFEEIHVNEVLFISVFGESLLNDAVTVVLYQIFQSFSEIGAENLIPIDFVLGGVSFFVVALGGVLIGLVWAFIVCFTTKYTKHVKILNPVFVFIMPYCAYLTAEMFKLSAIMAIVFCGIAMKQYIKLNISSKAITSIKYFTKMLSGMSETVIFMFLGLSTVSRKHHWDTAFVALTVLFCLVYRALGVVLQCFFLNRFRLVRFSKVDQFVMAYGGLRGAIAYGLVVAMPDIIPAKDMMITACIVVIYFTVFLQGMTMKPLVNFLKVEKEEKRRKTMTEYIFERLIDYTMTGIEDICGNRGHHWLRDNFETFNNKYLKPILVKKSANKPQDSKIVREYTRLTMREAVDIARGRIPSHQVAPGIVRSKSNISYDSTTDGANGSALGNTYTNPAFDLNSIEAVRSERMDHAGQNKHLDMDQMPHKRRHIYSRHNGDVDSVDVDLDDRRLEQIPQMGLRNGNPRNDEQDDRFYHTESDPKKVSFTFASGKLGGAYIADGRAASPPTHHGASHQLTAAETELPWKRPDSHPAVPSWRSSNPDVEDDDEEDVDEGERILRMSAASSSAASSNDEPARHPHEKVGEVKIDIHSTP